MVLKKIIIIFISICLITELSSCNKKLDKVENIPSSEKRKNENQKTNSEVSSETKSEVTEKWKPTFNTYTNSRYGYSVTYPSNLEKQTESQNGDGREFNSLDGFKMWVYGSNDVNVLNKNIEELYKEELKSHKDVTYKIKKKNWFVISGYDGEYIFYIKKYVGSGLSNTLLLKYPSNLRDKYYDVITVISKSFTQGNIDSIN